jgi:hypothetical protein
MRVAKMELHNQPTPIATMMTSGTRNSPNRARVY